MPLRRSFCLVAPCALLLAAGCGGTIGDDKDAPPPTVSISTGVLGTASGPVTVYFRFSADVGDSFTPSDITPLGGTLRGGSLTRVDGSNYNVVIDPTPGGTGTLGVSLGPRTFSAGGTANQQTFSLALPYEAPASASVPTVRITDSGNGGAARTSPIVFTFAFNVDVGTSFDAADITVTGGTKGDFSKLGTTAYSLSVTVPPASRGSVRLTLPAGAVANAGTGEANPREVQYGANYDLP